MDVELLHPKLRLLFLLDVANTDLDQEEDVLENHTTLADTLMVILTLLRQAEVFFPGERVSYSLLRLKLFLQEQPTLPVVEALLIPT